MLFIYVLLTYKNKRYPKLTKKGRGRSEGETKPWKKSHLLSDKVENSLVLLGCRLCLCFQQRCFCRSFQSNLLQGRWGFYLPAFPLPPAHGWDTYVCVIWTVWAKALRCCSALGGCWDSYGAQFEWEVTKIWGCILEELFPCGTGSDQRQSGLVSVRFRGQQWAAHRLDTGDGPLSAGGSGWVHVLFSLHQGLCKKALVQTRSFCSVAKCCPSCLRLLGPTAMWPCRSLLNWQRGFSPFCKFAFSSLIIIPGLYLPLDAQAMFLFTSP